MTLIVIGFPFLFTVVSVVAQVYGDRLLEVVKRHVNQPRADNARLGLRGLLLREFGSHRLFSSCLSYGVSETQLTPAAE